MAHVAANGQRFWVEDSGGNGPPVVLCHGFLLDHEAFTPQLQELRDVYRVITWDARGVGATEFDGRPFTAWDSARDIFGILDALGIERAVVGGMSQGGAVALRAALLHPDRVRGLVLINTQSRPEDEDAVAQYGTMIEGLGRPDGGGLVTRIAARTIADPELEAAWTAKWASWNRDRLRSAWSAVSDLEDITDRLPELPMPVVLIHGSRDTVVPLDRAREICEAVDDCRGIVEVADAGAAATLTHAPSVTPAIRAFLEDLPA